MADEDVAFVIKITFIFLWILCSINIILSILQLTNKGDYGYKGIFSMLENNPLLLEINKSECDNYISDINSNIDFAKIKTLIVLSYNALIIFYGIMRLKDAK